MEDVLVPNPVKLQPFRTFHEISQPEIAFVFRMKNSQSGVSCALFEADGGAWKFNAVHTDKFVNFRIVLNIEAFHVQHV